MWYLLKGGRSLRLTVDGCAGERKLQLVYITMELRSPARPSSKATVHRQILII